jgi:hypothetical protein
MKPFRKNVAISIDGGGIRGVVVTRALSMLEEHLGQSAHDIFRLAAGTSTGSIISAGIGAGLSAQEMFQLYVDLGSTILRKRLRAYLFPLLSRYRYPIVPLEAALKEYIGEAKMGDFWSSDPPTDVVITAFDLVENRTRFVKPWKEEYADWPVTRAVLASSAVPTLFPVIEGRYVDGGVGSYANPCYIAAYELCFCLEWDPAETTLISLGTGRLPHILRPGEADRFWAWDWIEPILDAFLESANEQQVHLVDTFFEQLDFRRFQVDLREPIKMDDVDKIPELVEYGQELGQKMLNDEVDTSPEVPMARVP